MAKTRQSPETKVERALRRQHQRDAAARRERRQCPTVGQNPEPDWRFTGGLQMRMEWRS